MMNLNKRKTLKIRSNHHKRWKCFGISATNIAISIIITITFLYVWALNSDLHYLSFSLSEIDPSPSYDHSIPLRYVTVILPSVVNPTRRRGRLEAITKTWGPGARAVYVLHDKDEYYGNIADFTDTTKPYPHSMILPPSITVEDGVARLRYVLQNILEHYDPDFTLFVNDHTYVLPHNACRFLRDRSPEEHLYAGHALVNDKKLTFNSGAAGYFLSRASLRGLTERWTTGGAAGDEHCLVGKGGGTVSKWLQGNPGLVTAECLGQSMGVSPVDTRDAMGRHLFHAFGLVRTVKGSVDNWYLNKHNRLDDVFGEDKLYHHQPRKSKECCSFETISFHYVESAETVALTKTLKMMNNKSTPLSNDQLKDYMKSVWPQNPKDIGGYSQGLPSVKQLDTWDDLLFVVKNIAEGVTDTPCFA